LHQRDLINEELGTNEGCGLLLTNQDVLTALEKLRKRAKMDGYGVCTSMLKILLSVRPGSITPVMNNLSCGTLAMKSLKLHGFAAAKKAGTISAKSVRVVTPLPCLLGILDAHVASTLDSVLDPIAEGIGRGFFEAARPKRQVLDLTHPLSLVLEKGGDLHGRAAVAQADIRQYYDNLRPLLLYRWLRKRAVDPRLCLTFLRLHCLPSIQVAVGQAACTIAARSCGVLTGSRSATIAGRVPLLDVAEKRLATWRPLAFSVPLASAAAWGLLSTIYFRPVSIRNRQWQSFKTLR